MVTTVILPAVRRFDSAKDKIAFFEKVENRFAWQAKLTTLITMISGVYMLYATDGWDRYLDPAHWWLHAMTIIWILFTVVLFILEPLILHKWYKKKAAENPEKTFAVIQRFHWILLTISLITISAAVAGSHGWFWF